MRRCQASQATYLGPLEPLQSLKFVRFRHLAQPEKKSPHHRQGASVSTLKLIFNREKLLVDIGVGLVTRLMHIRQFVGKFARHVLMQDEQVDTTWIDP